MRQKLVVNPQYLSLETQLKQLPEHFGQLSDIVHDARNQIRLWPVDSSMTLNVKRYRIPIAINRIVYGTLRQPKAKRAYDYALRLRKLGIETPEPIAYLLEHKGPLLCHSYLITRQCGYRRNFYEFGFKYIDGREEIIRSFARYTARLHELGVYHKDYSPGNILFDYVDGQWKFAIIDINRMSFRHIDMKDGCRNFARLWGCGEFFRLLAAEYASARGFDTETCIKLTLTYRNRFWKNRNHAFMDYD